MNRVVLNMPRESPFVPLPSSAPSVSPVPLLHEPLATPPVRGVTSPADPNKSYLGINLKEKQLTESDPNRLYGNAAGMPYDVSETRGNAGNAGETSPREGETFLQLWYADPYLGNVWGSVSGPKSHVSYAWFEMLAFDLEEEIRMQVGDDICPP
ncbi:hypothetical protein Tco_0201467 [Tanacetum coccineum]